MTDNTRIERKKTHYNVTQNNKKMQGKSFSSAFYVFEKLNGLRKKLLPNK